MVHTMSDKERVQGILASLVKPQFLKVTRDLTFDDAAGRRTDIYAGAFGYELSEEQIFVLHGASASQKEKMINEMMEAFNQGCIYALVCGYPCKLMPGDYQFLTDPPHHCCGELM